MRAVFAAVTFFIAAVLLMIILRNFLDERADFLRVMEETRAPEIIIPIPIPHGESRGIISARAVFTSEELLEMIENAPHYILTRPLTPHPERRMTESERDSWMFEYNLLGGMNAQELEMYMLVNEIRAEHGLPPFILCPRLSMAARLFSYLQVKYHTVGHVDFYYTDLIARSDFFGAYGTLYMENANSQRWYTMPDGTSRYIYLSPQELVDGWMESPDHRDHILTIETTHVGFGIDSGSNRVVPTMKSIMPR